MPDDQSSNQETPSGGAETDGHEGSDDESQSGSAVERNSSVGRSHSESSTAPNEERAFISDLIWRRVPQVLAGYLGVTWTLFQLMQWLTEQYFVSPYLGRAILFGLLMLMPAVVLVTYRHGRPGPDSWTSYERWGTVANVLLALFILGFAYGDAELGSMVKTVSAGPTGSGAEGTTGDTLQTAVRKVPKKEFRKRISLFYFDEVEDAKADTALRRVVAHAIKKDLDQDDFVSTYFMEMQSDFLPERGYDNGLNVPLGLKREIAQKVGTEYIISGEVGKTDDGFRLVTQLFEVETGQQVADRSFEGEDLFPLVDRATIKLKKDLQLPEAHLEKVADLPVTEVFTSSLKAAKYYATGRHLQEVPWNREKAYSSYRKSTSVDSTFALALVSGASQLWSFGKKDEAKSTYRQAERHDYRLTESDQYDLRVLILRLVENRPTSALKVCNRWTKLRPYDLDAWRQKSRIHEDQLQYAKALIATKRMLALSPKDKNIRLEVGSLLLSAGRLESALDHAYTLASDYPEDGRVQLHLGVVQWRSGEVEKAETAFKKAIRLDPNGIGSPTGSGPAFLATLYQMTGRFDKALNKLRAADRHEQSDRHDSYRLWHYYWLRGQINRSRAIFDSLQTVEVRHPKFHKLSLALHACRFYSETGQDAPVQEALTDVKNLEEAFAGTVPSYEVMTHTISANCLTTIDSLEEARYHLSAADSILEEAARPNLRERYWIDFASGRLHEAAGRYEEAAESYSTYEEVRTGLDFVGDPIKGVLPQYRKAISYQRLGDHERAEKSYKRSLKIYPAHPYVNYRYGQFLAKRDDAKQARSHIRRALEGWEPADSSFVPKQRARALLDSLDGGAV